LLVALQAVASEHPNEYLRKREETTNKPPSGRIGVIDGLDVIDDEVVATCEYVATEGGAAYRSWIGGRTASAISLIPQSPLIGHVVWIPTPLHESSPGRPCPAFAPLRRGE
jgi:predicted alpha/beta-hydrolase family hydrolase